MSVKEIKNRWMLIILVTVVGLFLDILTKYLADTKLTYAVPKVIFGDYLQLLLVYNKGAVFGMNPKDFLPGFPTHYFFMIFNSIATIFLIFYYKSLPKTERAMHWGIAFIIPGALGNLSDRFLHPSKGVVDFIKMGISEQHYWPIYNFADIYVTFGVIILMLCFLTEDKRRKAASRKSEPKEVAPTL
jgi:signal peptidase II